MTGFFRAHSSFLLTLGTGIVVGTSVTLLILRLRHNLTPDLSRLVDQIENLRRDLETLKGQLGQDAGGGQGTAAARPAAYFSAGSSGEDDDDDEFQEASEGAEDGTTQAGEASDGYVSAKSSSSLAPSGKDSEQAPDDGLDGLLAQTDRLLDGTDADKLRAHELLKNNHGAYKGNADFVWRLAKATYFLSQIEGARGNEEDKKALVYQSKDFAQAALQTSSDNPNVHKWFAITLGSLGDYESTQVKIENGFTFKEHIEKAIKLNPKDPSSHYLLGRWCFSVYMLSWLERQAAAALFATPPSATVDEALNHFLNADKLNPGKWKENLMFIAKCYVEKRDYYSAASWLEKANTLECISADDKSSQKEIDNLLYKYSGYRR